MQYYKDKGKIFFQVGLISALSLLILFFSYGWMTRAFANGKYETIQVAFVSGGGLSKGSVVCLQGVPQGFVEKVNITPEGVVFELKVELPFPLREGSAFVVEDVDLMGNKHLNILPSTQGDQLDLRKVHSGEVKITFNRFIARMNDLLDELEATNINPKRVGQIVDDLGEVVLLTRVSLDKLNQEDGVLDQTQEALLQTNAVLQKLNDEQTSMGKFLRDSIIYEQIVTSTKRLDSLLIDVKAHPTKYFKIEVF